MFGLALEGGGSRGAYHIGAYQAFMEAGITFDAITGTSIGAVNAALLAQGDWEKAREKWLTLSNEDLFDIDNARYQKLFTGKVDSSDLSYYKDALRQVREDGGVDTGRMQKLLSQLVDIQRLLDSPVDFGLVTVSIRDLKPVEVFKDQVPPQLLLSYIMASATFPGFQPTRIGRRSFIDGGLYDNCPMHMLVSRGHTDIIAVRIFGPGIFRLPKDKNVRVRVLEPSESLGPIMNFDPSVSARNLRMGYYDARRMLENLAGQLYYIRRPAEDWAFPRFCALSSQSIGEALRLLGEEGEKPSLRMLFEKLLPQIAHELEVCNDADYTGLLIAMLENRAQRAQIHRFAIYSLTDFFRLASAASAPPPSRPLGLLPTARSRATQASDFLLNRLLADFHS
ncbi:patatin-like phospholipase family protein [Intestinimonas butyriciproducens]|uniref:patatin-like phospholipase family protein n=1 Tax=Intestinimonas butyriciproducens TaxID=1297617 RepID=UPI00195C7224|nr:patatin-like phospholipase family protein [Intestinimonas butyriciproducens]MBM6917935.1 patatin-like phospholipase family protein [Intestinimonas butyriciproducens]